MGFEFRRKNKILQKRATELEEYLVREPNSNVVKELSIQNLNKFNHSNSIFSPVFIPNPAMSPIEQEIAKRRIITTNPTPSEKSHVSHVSHVSGRSVRSIRSYVSHVSLVSRLSKNYSVSMGQVEDIVRVGSLHPVLLPRE